MTSEKLAEICIFNGAQQKFKELIGLINFLGNEPRFQRVLEIGSASGGTLWLWCQLATKDATIISLDLPGGRFGNGRKLAENRIKKTYSRETQELNFIRRNSHSEKAETEFQKILKGEELDLLFIDGDHTYEGVKEDYLRYSKYVKKGGFIIFHDIVHHSQVLDCQVDKFWNELKEGMESYEFIDSEPDDRGWGTWGGLGLLKV